jgi:pyrroline-5-carboxylate reductase
MEKLTFIGNGNMAEAIIKGLIGKYEIEVYGRNQNSLKILADKYPTITTQTIQDTLNIEGKNIILCVKPNSLDDLSPKLYGNAKNIYSVLAGTKIATLKEKIPAQKYIRTMPNLAASYGKSMTTITGDMELQTDAKNIFDAIGTTLWVKSEKEIDIATAVAGSGPAFLSLIAEALSDGAVNSGLTRGDADILVKGLFDGFVPLLQNDKPANIKDGVMSPGGTTAAGYSALEKNGVRNGMIEAIDAAYQKAIELGKK